MQDSNSGSDEECDLQTLWSATAFSCYPILMSINIRTITIQNFNFAKCTYPCRDNILDFCMQLGLAGSRAAGASVEAVA